MTDVITTDLVSAEAVAADIARELREHPDHWTQGELARDSTGAPCSWTHDMENRTPVCWCLEGHIARRVHGLQRDRIFNRFKEVLGLNVIYIWNDKQARTTDDVIDLCDRVAGPGAGFAHFHAHTPALEHVHDKG